MAGSWRISLVLASLFLIVPSVSAFGGRLGSYSAPQRVSYYWVAPVYYYCPTGPIVIPVPDAPYMKYANPTAAPPSSTGEPPLQKTTSNSAAPVIIATRAPLDKSGPDRCRVGFWNLTGRDVTLTVDGKSSTLPRNRSVTMDLAHEFTWQIEDDTQHVERLSAAQAAHEVVIR